MNSTEDRERNRERERERGKREKECTPWPSGVESTKKQRVTINNPVGCSPERLHVCYEPNNDVIGPWKWSGRNEDRRRKGEAGARGKGLSHSSADDDGVQFRWNEKQIVFTGGNKSQRVVENVRARERRVIARINRSG